MIMKVIADNHTICLDDKNLIISNESESSIINCTYKERFNTLITLFDLQKNWESEETNDAKYFIYFNDNENEFTYNQATFYSF